MTVNAFIFMWCQDGIEAIIPITQYERWDEEHLIRLLKEQQTITNPLYGIVSSLKMRAMANTQRHYEIYAVDCNEDLTEEFWELQWRDSPQITADLIREKGVQIYSDRRNSRSLIV